MDNDIPQIFVLKNSFLATWILGNQNITSRIGIDGALKFSNNDFETIDYPIIFSNTAVYHTCWSINMGAGWHWEITPTLNLNVDGDLYLSLLPLDHYEIRQATQLIWSPTSWFSLTGGYLLAYGSYPYGKEFKVFPLVDTIFSFGGK